jgi:hypothetical protein
MELKEHNVKTGFQENLCEAVRCTELDEKYSSRINT